MLGDSRDHKAPHRGNCFHMVILGTVIFDQISCSVGSFGVFLLDAQGGVCVWVFCLWEAHL